RVVRLPAPPLRPQPRQPHAAAGGPLVHVREAVPHGAGGRLRALLLPDRPHGRERSACGAPPARAGPVPQGKVQPGAAGGGLVQVRRHDRDGEAPAGSQRARSCPRLIRPRGDQAPAPAAPGPRSGSRMKSIAWIWPPATLNPITAMRPRPRGTTAPAAPLTRAGRAKGANRTPRSSTRPATASPPRTTSPARASGASPPRCARKTTAGARTATGASKS